MARSGTVLVVEDDPSVLDITSFLLASEGYHVLTAASAAEALIEIRTHPDIGLVLTDMNMPGDMDGVDLVRELRRRGNGVRCVVVSGDALHANERLNGLAPFLAKPYERRTLLKAVGDALDS